MSLPHALLGLLQYRPSTGYELKTAFSQSIHFFWDATLPQIYRTLNQMEKAGWLEGEVKHQVKRPSKKVYRVTEAGINELRTWLSEPAQPAHQPRMPMLIKVFFGSLMDQVRLAQHLRDWRDQHAAMLEHFERQVEPVLVGYERLVGSREDGRNWRFTLDFGKRHARTVIEWCDAALAQLGEQAPARKGRKP